MPSANDFLPATVEAPLARAADVVLAALPALMPARRISVPAWAEENRRLETPTYRGPWRNSFAPYMVEPANMMTSRRFGAVVLAGPARSVKTESLVQNTVGHRIACMPRHMLAVAPTQEAAREFSVSKLDPFLRANRSLADRLLKTRNADAIHAKRFLGNMRLRIGWPVISQLSMTDIPDVLFTDYDRMPDDVQGEGNPFDLGRKRNQQFGTLGKTCAESSPGRPILDDDWRPSTRHEAPPCTGILSIYNRGTRGQWYWTCPECKEPFRPLYETLQCADEGSAGERARTTEMVCPHCGHCIAPDRKTALNRAGFWLHETDDGRLVRIDDEAVRDTDIASFWFEGPAAALQDWQQLKLRHLQAEEEFLRTGDEESLKATVNIDQGRPYRPRALTVGEGLVPEALKALADDYPLGIAPAGTRFVTVQVDVQGYRFAVGTKAWGVGLERWLIERHDIVNPPKGAPNAAGRAINPPTYFEDWAVLFDLLDKPFPVAGGDIALLPRAMVVDSGGAPGSTGHAYRFLLEAQRRGLGHRVFLVKGEGGDRPRAVLREPEQVLGNRKVKRQRFKIIFAGTDKLKDEGAAALMRKEAGPGKAHLSRALPNSVYEEYCAEHRLEKGWARKKRGLANESLDHEVYGKALVIVLGGEKIDWGNPPEWAREPAANSYGVRQETAGPKPVVAAAPAGRRVRSRGI